MQNVSIVVVLFSEYAQECVGNQPEGLPVIHNARSFSKLMLDYCSGFGVLVTLLLLSSGSVYAEWVLVFALGQGELTAYVDQTTIRRKEDVVNMSYLYDFKTIQTVAGNSFLSVKTQSEFDCAKNRSRILGITQYTGNMGRGSVVISGSDDEQKWEPVKPTSFAQELWKVACGKQ